MSKPKQKDVTEESKAYFAAGDTESALRSLREALKRTPTNVALLDYATWLFSTLNVDSEAVDALIRLSALSKLSAAQSCHLSGLLGKQQETEKALGFALEAVKLEPENRFYVSHCAGLLVGAGKPEAAVKLLLNALKTDESNADILRQLSISSEALGKPELALQFMAHACKYDPENADLIISYANLHMKSRDFDAAAAILENALNISIQHSFIFQMLISCYLEMGLKADALRCCDEAIRLLGEQPDLLLQNGVVLCALEEFDDAIDTFKKLLELTPDNDHARKACLAALTVAGRFEEAISYCSYLLSKNSADQQLRKNLKFLLTQQLLIDPQTEITASNFFERRQLSQRGIRTPRPVTNPFVKQMRIIIALIFREARTRFRNSKINYAWVIFEPLAHIGIMIVLINTFSHGPPPLGESFAVFYFTGIIPYHVFTHTAGYLMSSISGNKNLLQMPAVTTFDVTAARALVEFGNELAVALLLITAFTALGLGALPLDPLGVLGAFTMLWIAGFGMGMINCVVSIRFHGWEKLWGAITSLLYFASGTFYIPRMMPEWIRDILVWNPVLQGIELVRFSYFHEIQPRWLDAGYLAIISAILFCTGLFLLQTTKRLASVA